MSVKAGRRIARNTIAISVALVGQKFLSFFYFAMIARELSVEDTGRYFLATSFALLFSVLADLGFAPLLTREAAKLKKGVGAKLGSILGAKVLLSALTLVAINAIAWSIPSYPLITKQLITLASFAVIVESWNLTWYAILRGWQQLKYESAGILIGQGATVALGLVFLFTTQNLFLLITALIIGHCLNFVWALAMVKRRTGVPLRISFALSPVRAMFITVFPFALVAVFTRVTGFSDTFLLSLFGTEQMVGLYSVPFKVTFALQFIPLAFAASLLPAMSEFAKRSPELLARTFERSMLYLFYLALPIALGIAVLADRIIVGIFGAQFAPAILTQQVLVFTLVFLFINFPIGSLLVAVNRQKTQAMLVGIAMCTSVGVNIALIPILGILAPAIASVAAAVVLFAFGIVAARRALAYSTARLLTGALKAVIAGMVMVVAVFALKQHLPLAFLIAIGALVYGGALLALRAVTVQEIKTVLVRRDAVAVE